MSEVKSAEDATALAVGFVGKHRIFLMPLSARKEGGVWCVELDVGLFEVVKGRVRVDASTGAILDYEVSPALEDVAAIADRVRPVVGRLLDMSRQSLTATK